MIRNLCLTLALCATALHVAAAVPPFPSDFQTLEIQTDGATLHVRVGGQGPAIIMLHGFGDTGDMWAPLAAEFARDHRIVVPDLRGMGLSSRAAAGYEKKTQAHDIARVLDRLGIQKVDLITHDIGNMVGYAFAAQYPDRVTRFVIMDAPLPGIGPWNEILLSPLVWHFNFRGPDVERLVAGRERIYLDRFWNELSADPKPIDEATRAHYAVLYAQPGAMHCAFNQFAAFSQDATDNKALAARGKLTMPVLAIGAEESFGSTMADVMRFVATNVQGIVISNSGHWLMEEQPAATVAAVRAFLEHTPVPEAERRASPADIAKLQSSGGGAGTSNVAGIRMTVLSGNPAGPGLYTIRLDVPPNTAIKAHSHRDERTATVVSGTWYFGYGSEENASAMKALPPGSFYTEPAGVPHFARTESQPVVLHIAGYGPTDTQYVDPADDPSASGSRAQ